MSVWSQGAFPHHAGILLLAPQLITINQSGGGGVKRLDWGSVISSGCGGTPGWDKRVFPETPVTFLDHSCFHGETFNKVQIWSSSQNQWGRREKRRMLSFFISFFASNGLISPSGRAGN